MTLHEFLEAVGGAEAEINVIKPEDVLAAVQQNGYILQYVHNQTEAVCLAAVQQNGYILKYVHNQTEAVCLAAVQQNGDALQYVHNQTEAVCLAAVQQDGDALQYVDSSIFDQVVQEGESCQRT